MKTQEKKERMTKKQTEQRNGREERKQDRFGNKGRKKEGERKATEMRLK